MALPYSSDAGRGLAAEERYSFPLVELTTCLKQLKKGAALSFERAAPTQTNHYETRAVASLEAKHPMQCHEHCTELDGGNTRIIQNHIILARWLPPRSGLLAFGR
jgi:hypothetical protein